MILQIYFMEKLKQKEYEKQMQILREKQHRQVQAAKKMLEDDQVATIFKYCRKVLCEPLTESLSEYCPTNLSKFIFQEQLQKAKVMFDALPDKECRIDHFLLIMISIMKFPFQKWPYYLVGFKDMFNEIVPEKSTVITYSHFFKYIIGQVLDFKEEQQNTEFQVRFQELKKQDYLMHDNGVRKFYYSTDTKLFMTLDQSSYVIKLYNKQMKMVNKFTPNKQKHNKKYPNIISFDYSEMSNRLGLAFADSTVSIINFQNFLTKSKLDFETANANEIVIHFDDKILKIFYIQMLNRWALFTDDNRLKILDMEKYRQNDPDYLTEVKLQNSDLKLIDLLELVNLSMICLVAGNQVYFYNQNFTDKKHVKFSHGTNIKIFRYCEQFSKFYICGDEKSVTTFTMVRNSDSFNISTFNVQSKYNISTFQIFPLFNTIIIVDRNNDARLYDLETTNCYQQTSYDHIVKNPDNQIKMLKISKTQFALYETYTLVFHKEKIAIEKDSQFQCKPDFYYDSVKQEFYFSVNNQIISFSVPQGEIRKSYNMDTANVPKHQCFMIGKKTNLFIIDHQKNIYEGYLKDALADGQNKKYKKKIGVSKVIGAFYDEQISVVFVVGPKTIHTIRNDGNNNFTIVSTLSIQNFAEVIAARYNQHTKQILVLFQTQQWGVLDVEQYILKQMYSLSFPKDPNDHEDIMISSYDHDIDYDIDIIMTNHNQIYIVSKTERDNFIYLNLCDYLPYKLRETEFTSFKYCGQQKSNIYLLLSDKNGFLLQLNITKQIRAKFKTTERPFKTYNFLMKDLHTLENNGHIVQKIQIKQTRSSAVEKKHTNLFKAHDKQIQLMQRVDVQGVKTLTISIDGHIKLWEGTELLFHLKLPDLKKIVWNMDKIQKIKNQRSIGEVMKIINQLESNLHSRKSPEILLKLSSQKKNHKQGKQIKKLNLDEPIPLEIQNKDIQEIVQKTQSINWYSQRSDHKKRQRDREMSFTQRVNPHPWRTKNSFLKIMDKASPENKYSKKMPRDLINLRTSLDMRDRRESLNEAEKQIPVLPELKKIIGPKKQESIKKVQKYVPDQNQQENQQAFESCLYVKKTRNYKKTNELDEIDKEFKKKWLALTAKKWIPKNDKSKKKSQTDQKNKNKVEFYYAPVKQFKYDPIKEVKSIFEDHNRQASLNKKGRLIKIPDLRLTREEVFSND